MPAVRARLSCRQTCSLRGLAERLPDSPVQCARRSPASNHRGRRLARTRARSPRPRDPGGSGGQRRTRSTRSRLAGSISRARAHHAAGGAACTRVRVDEYSEAPWGRTRSGSLLVGRVLRRVARVPPDTTHTGTCRPRAHLARRRRLEATRPRRAGRAAPSETVARGQGVLACMFALTRAHSCRTHFRLERRQVAACLSSVSVVER